MIRFPFVTFALLALVCATDLKAQRRRGPGMRPGGNQPSEPGNQPPPVTMDRTKVRNWLLVEGGDLCLGTGQVMSRANVLVGDDKIYEIGQNLDVPADAKRLDAKGKVVSPGFVAVRCTGLGAPASAQGKIADSVNPFEPMMKAGLAAGITSFVLTLD